VGNGDNWAAAGMFGRIYSSYMVLGAWIVPGASWRFNLAGCLIL